MCNLNSGQMMSVATTLIVFLTFMQFLSCKANFDEQHNRFYHVEYAQLKDLFPKLNPYEKKDWRAANNYDDIQRHPCKRECIANQSMTCYYYMIVHNDHTMGTQCDQLLRQSLRLSRANLQEYAVPYNVRAKNAENTCNFADGVKTEIMIVNGQLPGQAIEVCVGDTVVADVINSLQETTTIHWHGLHQRKTPHMDGVPHITQYPIMPGQAFRYRFEVDRHGTNWWHSHTNHQRAFGLAGAFIVRQPKIYNVHEHRYDFDLLEHTIMIQDWVHDYDETVPENILINGLGQNVKRKLGARMSPTIYASFSVVQGARYRFRVIFNGIANCPVSFSIDNHDLIVIASDGNDIEPVIVQKITFHGAERFDFVLHANQAVENYWIRVKGYNFCAEHKLHQEAILQYKGADSNAKPTAEIFYGYEPAGIELNPIETQNIQSDGKKLIRLVDTSTLQQEMELPLVLFRTYYTSMSVFLKGNELLFQIDDITFQSPMVSLLQTRNLGVGGLFCNRSSLRARGRNCDQANCACSNVIHVPAFKYVEFVISSTSGTAHPIHLHGYTFRVVGMGVLGENRINSIEEIDRKTPLPRRRRGAPLKDSVQVPGFGYTIIRFYTDNPGYWLFHCHISTHSEKGMAAVLKVGDDIEMKLCPVSNCGLCGSVL